MSRIWGTGLLKGMVISMRNMLRGPITVQYPEQKVVLPERSRWDVQLKLDENGHHKCTACMTCVRACPNHIIDIRVTTREDKTKHIDVWQYEGGACMMCGLCVEACPFDAIKMGQNYELANFSRAVLTYNLLDDVDAVGPKRKAAVAAPVAAAAPSEGETPKAPAADAAPAEDTTTEGSV